jgi:hypothetical protein
MTSRSLCIRQGKLWSHEANGGKIMQDRSTISTPGQKKTSGPEACLLTFYYDDRLPLPAHGLGAGSFTVTAMSSSSGTVPPSMP